MQFVWGSRAFSSALSFQVSPTATQLAPIGSDELAEGDWEELPQVKGKIRPVRPSAAEVAEHEINHYPYRAWCRVCVAASGRRDAHPQSGGQDSSDLDAVALVAFDYCFFHDSDTHIAPEVLEKTHAPILVAKDKGTEMLFADVLQRRGAND